MTGALPEKRWTRTSAKEITRRFSETVTAHVHWDSGWTASVYVRTEGRIGGRGRFIGNLSTLESAKQAARRLALREVGRG